MSSLEFCLQETFSHDLPLWNPFAGEMGQRFN